MAEIERIAYESVNVTTPFKLMTFSTEWGSNILLQPEEKICKRCPKRAQYTVTYFFGASYILFLFRNSLL